MCEACDAPEPLEAELEVSLLPASELLEVSELLADSELRALEAGVADAANVSPTRTDDRANTHWILRRSSLSYRRRLLQMSV